MAWSPDVVCCPGPIRANGGDDAVPHQLSGRPPV